MKKGSLGGPSKHAVPEEGPLSPGQRGDSRGRKGALPPLAAVPDTRVESGRQAHGRARVERGTGASGGKYWGVGGKEK